MTTNRVQHPPPQPPRGRAYQKHITTNQNTKLVLQRSKQSKQSSFTIIGMRRMIGIRFIGMLLLVLLVVISTVYQYHNYFSHHNHIWQMIQEVLQQPRPIINEPYHPFISSDMPRKDPVLSFDLHTILQQTICPKESSLLNLYSTSTHSNSSSRRHISKEDDDDEEERMIQLWTVRILYAILYEHQHLVGSTTTVVLNHYESQQPSQPSQPPQPQLQYHSIPDMSSPTSTTMKQNNKYIIISLSKNGIGANVRLGMIPILQIGIVLNRIVLFINDFTIITNNKNNNNDNNSRYSDTKSTSHPFIPKSLLQPWSLASCRDDYNTNDLNNNIRNRSDTNHDQFTFHNRNDYNCFFRPISSHSITPDDFHTNNYNNSSTQYYTLPRNEIRYLFRHGQLWNPNVTNDIPILIVPLSFRPQRQPIHLPTILHQRAKSFVRRYIQQQQQQQQQRKSNTNNLYHDLTTTNIQFNSVTTTPSILYRAVDAILTDGNDNNNTTHPNHNDNDFNYYGANSMIYQSFLLYALRPNEYIQQQLDKIVRPNIIPYRNKINRMKRQPQHHNNNNNTITVGLPIRASDKCSSKESECLPSFREYLDAAHEIVMERILYHSLINENITSSSVPVVGVIVTTESKQVRDEMEQYQNGSSGINHRSMNYQFIINPYDVTQDTGYFDNSRPSESLSGNNHTNKRYGITENDIMLSTLSSLQLQLYATDLTVGNCCSNFHLIMKDLLNIGCGVSTQHHHFQCLQKHPNTKYRICCSWDKSIECQNRRRQDE